MVATKHYYFNLTHYQRERDRGSSRQESARVVRTPLLLLIAYSRPALFPV